MVLDNLKDVWKNQQETVIKFSETDIYKMIHKKSTSIVKWIFYISILEFVVFMIFPLLFRDLSEVEDQLHVKKFFKVVNVVSYLVGLLFIFIFYKNYKLISVTDSTKKLMNTILKTRNSVKLYIIAQLSLGAVAMLALFYKITISESFLSKLPENFNSTILWVVFLLAGALVLGFVWLFYKLIYGLLLNKLKLNYKELQKG